jgi:hypothetical protein
MENKKLTPMMELIEILDKELQMHDFRQLSAYTKATELLEKERQMVIDAYVQGGLNLTSMNPKIITPEQYYNETYKTK